MVDTDKGFPAIRGQNISFPPPPKALFQNHSRFVIFSCFFFCLPFQHCFFHQPLSRYYSCFVSLALSLLPLSFLRSCFVPSNQFPAIPFSNPPCFHFWSFRSSILPLFTQFLLQVWRFLLSFSCWFLFGLLLTVVVTIFPHWGFSSQFLFLVCLVERVW